MSGPSSDGQGGDVDPALGQELGDLPGRERVAEVPAHAGQDHLGRPTVAGEGGTRELGEVSAAGATGVALATAAIVAVALGGRLLADQAGIRRQNLLPAPHNFPDSH
jgi:hypothetical protein